MITLPTCELLGLVGDVISFALDEPVLPELSLVQLSWDGIMLHTMATDRYRIGWASWHPADPPDDEHQPSLLDTWGGDDDPWQVLVPYRDAAALLKAFKLPKKRRYLPVTLDLVDGHLLIRRAHDAGYAALTMDIVNEPVDEVPDVQAILARCDVIRARREVRFNANWLADFASVRARGSLELTFTGGKMALVRIGERFLGAIAPLDTARPKTTGGESGGK